jgi:hypothetical protein
MAVVAGASLPYLYSYPKQDFEGALRFIDSQVQPGDGVYTVGIGTELPYHDFYGRKWPRLREPSELAAARGQHGAIWLVYTFPGFLNAHAPGLMADIAAHCPQQKAFWGTLEDGEIVAARCAGA